MIIKHCGVVLALGVLGAATCSGTQAAEVFGQVCDVTLPAQCGISGVTVTLKQPGKLDSTQPTDAIGNYRFKVSRTTELQLIFAKIGYQARPTIRRVFAEGPQPTVSLIKENASSAYYADLAKKFIQLPEASVEGHARTIATLQPLDLAKVKQAVADESAFQRLRALEAAERETRAVSDWE